MTKDSTYPHSKHTTGMSKQIFDPLTSDEHHSTVDDGDRELHKPNDDTQGTEPGECVSTSVTAQATDTTQNTPGNKVPLLVSKLTKLFSGFLV